MRRYALLLAVVAGAGALTAPAATPDRKPPRIVSAAMQDSDRDYRADGVRLTYSERIRHPLDRDGKYPFSVVGYSIRSVGAASGRTLVVGLVEKAQADPAAKPRVRYQRTRLQPVKDRAGNQAPTQVFIRVRPHANVPPPRDSDGDGYLDAQDCGPMDAAINPGAADLPDLSLVDSNCDGIDGTEVNAVFASPFGNDANPGTRAAPKREVQAAVVAAAPSGRYVLVAGGSYVGVTLTTGVSIYGGYNGTDWSRSAGSATQILGVPQGIVASGATGVRLQLLSVTGSNAGETERSAYGIRAINGSSLTLESVTVTAGVGANGPPGTNGQPGLNGAPGGNGLEGSCDEEKNPAFDFGGPGGDGIGGRRGGKGGDSGYGDGAGKTGDPGVIGIPGGPGGAGGNGGDGGNGQNGTGGAPGLGGGGGTSSTTLANVFWRGVNGSFGRIGDPGNGGGGGGGGGGQGGVFVDDGTGNGGGGGGGAGGPGFFGDGGRYGGGSFGLYLFNSEIVAESSSIRSGSGGVGGRGGNGGAGGLGAAGGVGGKVCPSEVGMGGDGGSGGNGGVGGAGGGGAGGPSVGVMKVGTSSATLTSTPVSFGAGGGGGPPGSGGTVGITPSQPGIAQAIYP